MQELDANTVVVSTPGDLADALGMDNGYDYIYLGADITIASAAGILVSSSKTSVVIDGLHEPTSPDIRTLADYGGDDGMIRVNTTMDITFKNLTIFGRNYFGMPRVYDNAANEQTTVTYQNVTYTGPQMTWHVRGKTRYIDCDITIQNNGNSDVEEVAEIRWVEIGGNTTIRHNNNRGWQVFRFYYSTPYVTILKDANVNITTMQHFLFDASAGRPQITVQQNAGFTLTTNQGICYDNAHRVSSFLVEQGANFEYYQKGPAGGDAALVMIGPFTVNKGATVYMEANFAGSNKPLIHFRAATGRGLYINSPRDFVLYNTNTGRAVSFSTTANNATPFSLVGGQVNMWETAMPLENGGGTFTDVAPNRWYKPDWSTITLTGTAYSPTSSTATGTTVSSNTFDEEGIEPPTPIANLQLHKAQVLSVGDFPLLLDPVVCQYKRVTGRTDTKARVMVDYTVTPFSHSVEATVDPASGVFTAPTEGGEELPLGTEVTVVGNIPFLLKALSAAAVDEGLLEIIFAPPRIVFAKTPTITSPVALHQRKEDDPENPEPVIVSDTRAVKTAWQLWASISGPLETSEGDTLPNAVVFVFEDESLAVLGTTPIPIYTDGPYEEPETPVVWAYNKGVLAQINVPIRTAIEYSTILTWEVHPVPEP